MTSTPPVAPPPPLSDSQHPMIALEESLEILKRTCAIPLSSSSPSSFSAPVGDTSASPLPAAAAPAVNVSDFVSIQATQPQPQQHASNANKLRFEAVISTTKPSTIDYTWVLPIASNPRNCWIGLYACGGKNYLKYQWANGNSGKGSFDSLIDGLYQLKLFLDKELIATTPELLVGEPCTLSVGGENLRLLVIKSKGPAASVLGVFKEGSDNSQPFSTKTCDVEKGKGMDVVEKTTMMETPRAPGKYELRMFKMASSPAFSAIVPFTVPNQDYLRIEKGAENVVSDKQAQVVLRWHCRAFERSNDWIGLYAMSDCEEQKFKKFLAYKWFTDGKLDEDQYGESGSVEWTLPLLNSGKYCFVMFSGQLPKYEPMQCPTCSFDVK